MARLRPGLLAGILLLGAGFPDPATAQRANEQAAPPQARTRTQQAALPQPLSAADAGRLRRAFEAQARGDMAAAVRESERLDDRRLMGHLLADRYLRGETGVYELQAWLADFSDLPDAPAVHERLVASLPRGAAAPPPPRQQDAEDQILPEERSSTGPRVARDANLDRAVQQRLNEGNAEAALTIIQGRRRVSAAYLGQLKAEAAQGFFRQGRDADALRVAQEAMRLSPQNAFAAYQAGLAAWATEQYDVAQAAFERAARNDKAPATMRAAAAFWTARSAVRARHPALYVPWMMQAAQEPRTFYGMIARRSLGLQPGLVWEHDIANDAHAQRLAETAGGWRALALLQIGQKQRAEAELRLLHRRARNNPQVTQGILMVAQQAALSRLSAQVASQAQGDDGRSRDIARFPLPVLLPNGGFRIDPSLLYALALQESSFDPNAISPAGARGILQIMPATASYVANDPTLNGDGVERLHDQGFGLEIGQRYIHYLARHETVRGNLVRVLAAYNAGPGNLARWLPATRHREDPLLFIESIPLNETRSFVSQVLTYSWIYANRLGLPSPSLDQIAGGNFPTFPNAEEVTAMLRRRPQRTN